VTAYDLAHQRKIRVEYGDWPEGTDGVPPRTQFEQREPWANLIAAVCVQGASCTSPSPLSRPTYRQSTTARLDHGKVVVSRLAGSNLVKLMLMALSIFCFPIPLNSFSHDLIQFKRSR